MSVSNQETELPVVAVIGTGTMGAAMAQRLLGAGLAVRVWARRRESMSPLVDLGATAGDQASETAAKADVVISMLPTAQATAEVMLSGGVVAAMRPDSTWAQMATIGTRETEWLAGQTQIQRADISFVDAPVSGSRQPAEDGELLILASGPKRAERSLEPVFSVLGKSTLWLGSAGAGSAMKLVLNTWLAFQTECAAESAAVAERLGVSTAAMLDALHDSPLASQYALAKLDRMIKQDYHPDFALDWALKDLDLVASDGGAEVAPVAVAIANRWRELVHDGSSGLDVSAARRGLG